MEAKMEPIWNEAGGFLVRIARVIAFAGRASDGLCRVDGGRITTG
jgi:hypothetical protein